MAIAMEIYEKIRYYREHTDYSQRNVAKTLGVSRNTVKKYWEGQTVPCSVGSLSGIYIRFSASFLCNNYSR